VRGENLKGRRLPNAGRRKGSPNKTTLALREAILQSFNERGGVNWLNELPDEIFASLVARILPKAMELSGSLEANINFRDRLASAREKAQSTVVSLDHLRKVC